MQESEFDPQGKLIEHRIYHPDGSLSHRETRGDHNDAESQTFQLDNEGRATIPLAHMTIEVRQDGNRATIVAHAGEDSIVTQVESGRVGDVATCLITVPIQLLKTERVNQRDSIGNWISKTLFESNNPDEIGEPVSTIERTIIYW